MLPCRLFDAINANGVVAQNRVSGIQRQSRQKLPGQFAPARQSRAGFAHRPIGTPDQTIASETANQVLNTGPKELRGLGFWNIGGDSGTHLGGFARNRCYWAARTEPPSPETLIRTATATVRLRHFGAGYSIGAKMRRMDCGEKYIPETPAGFVKISTARQTIRPCPKPARILLS